MSCSSTSSSEVEFDGLNPTRLLSMAIRKRRNAYSRRERDLREELLHTSLIQSLCKFLGEGRARRRKHRRSKHTKRRSTDRKREWSDNEAKLNDESNAVELTALNGESIVNSSFSADCGNVIQPIVQRPDHSSGDGVQCVCDGPPNKMSRLEDTDPFGLDSLFAEFYGRNIPSGGLLLLSFSSACSRL